MVSFYFDKRRTRKDGSVPIRLAVRFNNKSVMVATDVCVMPDQWHQKSLRVVNHPRRKALNSYLDTLRLDAEQVEKPRAFDPRGQSDVDPRKLFYIDPC